MTPKQVKAAQTLCEQLATAGIETLTEARVLFAATEGNDMPSVGMLVDRTGLPFSTVSRVAWKLLERGWFKYETGNDRRAKYIRVNLDRLA
jgi:DNA-binding MarR family transcriptional regulator